MIKVRIILTLTFAITFAAGVTVGMAFRTAAKPAPPERSWLERELDLSPEQHAQMRTIWSEVMREGGRQSGERRQALQRQREEAVRALLTEEQLAAYEKVQEDYRAQQAEINKEREGRFQEAVRRTNDILNEEQRAKYEEMLKRGMGRDRRRGRGRDSGRSEGPPTPPPSVEM